MRKTAGFICMGLGAALLIAALSLLLYNRAESKAAVDAVNAVMPELVAAIKTPSAAKPDTAENPEVPSNGENTAMTVAEIKGEEYIGYLTIPVLELELPVMSDWDETKLKIAPCRYFGSTKTDDLVICGHNYPQHFGRLKDLRSGDVLLFTDMDGVTAAYEVRGVEYLQPTQISEMIESEFDLSLYTCTYGGQSRITVRCTRL